MNIIIIPSYQPSNTLLTLVKALILLHATPILVVDDGSEESKQPIFLEIEKLNCTVIHHKQNQGKGAAIKTAIQYASKNYQNITGFVTCDGDGQHTPEDIIKVSNQLSLNQDALILGSRDFSSKDVPRNSRFGNWFSSLYFKLTTGITCKDTQTGLRGIPLSFTSMALCVKENRYDYEMNFLISVAREKLPILFVSIETVYFDDNSSSHFRPIVDSIKIYKEPIKFSVTSLLSAAIDLGLFTLITTLLDHNILKLVFIATLSARVVSGIFNFLMNRIWSFRSKSSIHKQFMKYGILYVAQLGLSITFVYLLSFIPIHLTIIKIFVDSILFIGSFFIQKHWVFKKKKIHIDPNVSSR